MSALRYQMVHNAFHPGIRRGLLFAATTLLSLNLAAGDKIEIVGGGVNLPEKKSILDGRSSSFDVGDKPDISGGFVVPNIPIPNSASRELLEEADRKKNWIFVNPYKMDKRTTGLEKLEKKGSSNPLDFEEPDNQSVLERYLTEKDRRLKENRELLRREDRLDRDGSRADDRYNTFSARAMDLDRDLVDGDDRAFARELSLNSFLNTGPTQGAAAERDPYEKNHFSFDTIAERRQVSPEQQVYLQQQEEQRAAAFQRLLQPRSITPSIGGVVDPINGQADPSRQAYNPIAPQRPDPLDFNRNSGSSYDSSSFTASRPVQSLPNLGRSSALEAFETRAPQAAISSSPLPVPDRGAPAPVPGFGASSFTLEIPKRKF